MPLARLDDDDDDGGGGGGGGDDTYTCLSVSFNL